MDKIGKPGTLYLIPTPLTELEEYNVEVEICKVVHSLRIFIVEKSKTARQFIKSTNPPYTQQEIVVIELNKHADTPELYDVFKQLKNGASVGLISEAGCPGVADPGAEIVASAHEIGVIVKPLVGPSSILLALMSSGMNGQKFCFHGYLPQDRTALITRLQKLEADSLRLKETQIWIETPYRNNQMIESCLVILKANTHFCIAAGLTGSNERIYSGKIKTWTKDKLGDLHKIPAVYLLQS